MAVTKTYGDVVVLVRRGNDGTVTRTNSVVLASRSRVRTTVDRREVKDSGPVEHLDVAYPELSLAPNGRPLQIRDMDAIFRPAYDVAPWSEGSWIGYEEQAPGLADAIDGQIVPVAQLVDLSLAVVHFDESLDATPEAVVGSAIAALGAAREKIDQLEAIVNQQPAQQPAQPDEPGEEASTDAPAQGDEPVRPEQALQ